MTFVCSMCQNNMLLNNLAYTYEFVDEGRSLLKVFVEIVQNETPGTGKTWSRFMSRLWQKIDTRQPFLCSMWRLCRMKTFVCIRCGARHEYNWGYAPKCARVNQRILSNGNKSGTCSPIMRYIKRSRREILISIKSDIKSPVYFSPQLFVRFT
jgi:hypothetical protein